MSSVSLVRTGGGLASAAAGLLLLLGHILDVRGDPEYGTVLGGTLVLTPHVVLVFALVALWAAQSERSGLLGSLGMVLGVVGTTLVSGVVMVEIAGASGVEVDAVLGASFPSVLALLGGLAFLIGLVLFGVATMRAGVLPRWAGLLLIVGDAVFGAGSGLCSTTPARPTVPGCLRIRRSRRVSARDSRGPSPSCFRPRRPSH
jgi:hypothetical protein